MKKIFSISLLLLGTIATGAQAAIIYSDDFSDGNRNGWYAFTSSSGTAPVVSQAMALTPGTGSISAITYFTPTTLAVGESMTLAFDFKTAALDTAGPQIRFGLFDSGGTQINTDLATTGDSAFGDDTGYASFNSAQSTTVAQTIRARNNLPNNTFWSAGAYPTLASSSFNAGLSADTFYSAKLTIDYVSTGNITLTSDFAGTITTMGITTPIFTTFDTVSIFNNGMPNTAVLTVDNVVVSVVPEPSTWVLFAAGSLMSYFMATRRRHRPFLRV